MEPLLRAAADQVVRRLQVPQDDAAGAQGLAIAWGSAGAWAGKVLHVLHFLSAAPLGPHLQSVQSWQRRPTRQAPSASPPCPHPVPQYCLWDHVKEVEGLEVRRLTNLARLFAAVIAGGGLPSTTLKVRCGEQAGCRKGAGPAEGVGCWVTRKVSSPAWLAVRCVAA